jgi:uncharacterized protein YecT (DUF1311 family)
MTKSIPVLLSIALLSIVLSAEQYKYKDLKEFKTLDSFKSVEEFETYYERYVQDCLDNTYAGTMGIPCYVGYDLWDRELNKYYKKLHFKLNPKEKQILEESQRTWIKDRDLSIKLNSMMLDKEFVNEGTLYSLIRAGAADGAITPIIKQRALLLRSWNISYSEPFSLEN